MRAVDMSCEVVAGLVVPWLGAPGGEEMSERELDAFEQHLLYCPPCMAYGRNARIALDALRAAGPGAVSRDLRESLAALVRAAAT
ncbi:zf-HC2 domain-containing protein [Spongiactinospora sp. TRM90649]|uniref:zf-HC2 domain-containing protein n=1 Tax=Spongiactinospora sp. TRM90649 TaxID=3031114 RepID=UPI0023F6A516|nr:zf-HC2 domain-containing protein [Spongiactinospora sp. TRM90649]MDF5752746.1 hypothetical protein [Spongiactinospora sp. TRM90649]